MASFSKESLQTWCPRSGASAFSPEPTDHIIRDGVTALKPRQSDSLSAHDVSTLFNGASTLPLVFAVLEVDDTREDAALVDMTLRERRCC